MACSRGQVCAGRVRSGALRVVVAILVVSCSTAAQKRGEMVSTGQIAVLVYISTGRSTRAPPSHES